MQHGNNDMMNEYPIFHRETALLERLINAFQSCSAPHGNSCRRIARDIHRAGAVSDRRARGPAQVLAFHLRVRGCGPGRRLIYGDYWPIQTFRDEEMAVVVGSRRRLARLSAFHAVIGERRRWPGTSAKPAIWPVGRMQIDHRLCGAPAAATAPARLGDRISRRGNLETSVPRSNSGCRGAAPSGAALPPRRRRVTTTYIRGIDASRGPRGDVTTFATIAA
jgi:hypothetical protein